MTAGRGDPKFRVTSKKTHAFLIHPDLKPSEAVMGADQSSICPSHPNLQIWPRFLPLWHIQAAPNKTKNDEDNWQ
jgi:hypothetical protein